MFVDGFFTCYSLPIVPVLLRLRISWRGGTFYLHREFSHFGRGILDRLYHFADLRAAWSRAASAPGVSLTQCFLPLGFFESHQHVAIAYQKWPFHQIAIF